MKKYDFLDLGLVNKDYMDALSHAAERVIRSGRYIGGTEVDKLEKAMCRLTGARYAVGVSNGLDALRLILRGYIEMGRLAQGDGIILPANTYIATALAVSDAGLRPVLADVSEETMNLTADSVAAVLDDEVKGVITVHLYGRIAYDKALADLAKEWGLLLIEDSAQAIGAISSVAGLSGETHAGALGDAAAFSFYPTKNVGALGDAGCVTTSDEELANVVRALANYGAPSRYHNLYKGFNCRLDPIQAAMLVVKLAYLEKENGLRREKAHLYNNLINNSRLIKPTIPASDEEHIWHQYVLRVADGKRDEFRRLLAEKGVGTDVHYAKPVHLQPCYTDLTHAELPMAERLCSEIVSLPISCGTSTDDISEISEIINNVRL